MLEFDLLDLVNDILRSSNDSSRKSPNSILLSLMERLPLKACSFYSYNEMNEVLTLRSQVGLSYRAYESFQLPIESTAGRSVKDKIPKCHVDVAALDDYRDKGLIEQFGLRSVLTIPLVKDHCSLLGEHDICDPVVGVICLYPNLEVDPTFLGELLDCADKLSFCITQAYIHSVNYDQLRIRNEIFQFALSSTDLSSFCHRLTQLLKKNWGFGGVSIFLLDDRSSTLKLKGTTGLKEDEQKTKTFYRLDESEDVPSTYKSGKPEIRLADKDGLFNGKYNEQLESTAIASLCLPVFEPKTPYIPTSRKAGVIRVANCTIYHGNSREEASFGWEDLSLLTFVATVVGVITHLFTKVSRMSEDFERAIHGIQNNLLFVNNNLNQLLERSGVNEIIDPVYAYHIPDCIDHVEALSWQMERFIHGKNPGEIVCSETKLAGDVLTKITAIHKSMTKFFNVIPEPGPLFDHSRILKIPTIYAEEEALITVFRNLTENSIKYSSRNKRLKIWIDWKVEDDRLIVDFEDNGIGIETTDADYIFAEGYKAENAMRRSTIGAGLGLYQCKRILEQMKGTIELTHAKQPTRFTVTLELWRT